MKNERRRRMSLVFLLVKVANRVKSNRGHKESLWRRDASSGSRKFKFLASAHDRLAESKRSSEAGFGGSGPCNRSITNAILSRLIST